MSRVRFARWCSSLLEVWRLPRVRARALAMVVLVVAAVLLFRGLRQGGVFGSSRPADFAAYHAAAEGVLRGDLAASYSAPRPYQYPPTLAVLIAPLGLLPYRAAAALWAVGSVAVLLLALRGTARALGPSVTGADQVLGLLLIARAAESDLANGNANCIVLGLLVLGFVLDREGRAAAGGAVLGIAAAVKVTPIILLLWMLLRGRWRQAGGFVTGLLVAAVLLPALVLGPGDFSRSYRAFHGSILAPLDATGPAYRDEPAGGYVPGQSLRAFLHRLLRASDATAHDDRAVTVHLLNLPKETVDSITIAVSSAVLAVLLLRTRGQEGGRWSAPEAGAALAAMVLLSPLSRKAHFVVLLPAAVIGSAIARGGCPRRTLLGRGLWWGAFALMVLTAPGVVGREASTRLLAFCPMGIAAGLLALLCALPRPVRAPAPPP